MIETTIYKSDNTPYLIPQSDILTYSKINQKLKFNGQTLIAAKTTITINNVDRSVYDDRYSNSLFYAGDWYNWTIQQYDTELKTVIWNGRLKNIEVDDNAGSIVLETVNYVRELADTNCIISVTDKTPADIALDVLTDPVYLAIPETFINRWGFQQASGIFTENSVLMRAEYTQDSNIKCISVLEEICRITQSYIYPVNNIIQFYHWQPWDGQIGTAVDTQHVIPKSYKHGFDDETIYNEYLIKYYDTTEETVTDTTGYDLTSQSKYGKRCFNVPNSDIDSTSLDDFKLILQDKTGADYCGELALTHYSTIKKIYQITLNDKLQSKLHINSQADLNIEPFTREPTRIQDYEYDPNKGLIKIKGEFLNLPNGIDRDTTPPATPVLKSVLPNGDGSITLRWTRNKETDIAGYYIFFSSSPGDWHSEYCSYGQSPISTKNPTQSNTECFYTLNGLENGTVYYFCVKAYDTKYNTSGQSNTLQGYTYSSTVNKNLYCCTGEFLTGLSLDIANSEGGYVVSGYTHYDEINYDAGYYAPTAIAESIIYQSRTGLKNIVLFGSADTANDIQVQYRVYDNGSFGTWSTAVSAVGICSLNTYSALTVQVRIIFNSPLWSDSDTCKIIEINHEVA